MATVVKLHAVKARVSRLLDRARAGEEIVLSRVSKPSARRVPCPGEPERRSGHLAGRLTDPFFEPLPEDELAAWGR